MNVSQIQDLYLEEKLSTWEIARKLGISQWSVIYLMRRKNIPRRTSAESNRIKFLKTPLSYNKKAKLNAMEKSLHEAALMLYWAEGVKKGKHTVDFVNSDEKMILIFLTALRKIYGVNENKLRILLYCYTNQSSQRLIEYWSKLLRVSKAQFTKPYIRKDFNLNKINKMPHGLVHIRYADKRLLMQIKSEIDIIQKRLNKLEW
ncbi:hypothetical protein HY008_00555 [Candidatus Woesebacteria bacterium]|nr:hypothetical protein [Candidatus Woesebacteria bacterium]